MDSIFAYIDPGSGSLVVQALIAGLVALPIFFRHQISRIVRTLRRPRDPDTGTTAGPDDSPSGS